MNTWIVTGSPLNLKTSLQKARWGVNRGLKNTWDRVTVDDLLLFYVTSPVRGVVGVANVKGKAEENDILWRDEAVVGRVLYPYRITFKTMFVLKEEKWESDRIKINDLKISIRAGINPIKNEETLNELLDRIAKSWNVKIS